MTASTPKPLRVEQALRLLPDVDALVPLRAFLMSTSRRLTAAEPHLTVGKRQIRATDLPDLVPRALQRVTEHLTLLYGAAIEAIEAEERGNAAACVQAFLRAGVLEQRVGRETAARAWFEHALGIAEGARDRRPEIEALQHLGALDAAIGDLDRAARAHQRSFVLAESEEESARAAAAAISLGEIALRRDYPRGALSWYTRAFDHASSEPSLLARLALGRAELGLATDAFDEAERWVRTAEEQLIAAGPSIALIDLLRVRGRLAARRGHTVEALSYLREALMRLPALERDPRTEFAIRIEISQLFLAADRLPDAEDEIRRVEELAIVHNIGRELANVYLLLGELRGRQREESGFVFFEKAIELSRAGEAMPRLEARAYLAYARFRAAFGEGDEARAYLERAREILELVRDPKLEAEVESALTRSATV